MFYVKYLFSEIFRRWGRTLTVSIGLAMASAIIILIISFSQALSSAQDKVLSPLENVGTDMMLSRSVEQGDMQNVDESTRDEMMKENRITTDLSKLGDPGDDFSLDTFLPGSLLTFESSVIEKLDKTLVADFAQGLIMSVAHQEGKIPSVTAEFETGGETIDVEQDIAPMTDEERVASDAARQKAQQEIKDRGLDPQSEEAREIQRQASDAAMPERFSKMRVRVQTEKRTYTQNVGPISTDISTQNLTVAGVQTDKKDIGLILPSQIVEGKYFDGENQIVVNKSYADKQSKKIGGKITLNNKEYDIVGFVEPKLYTNSADLYLSLAELQQIAGRENRINILLIKSTNASSVEETSGKLAETFTGAKVTNSADTAKQVSGSLVSAANLTNRFILLVSIIVIVAAFIIVSLLTISSINKRTREIGTLKAIGWSNSEVVRQILLENIATGIIGAIIGIGIGVLAIYALNQLDISFSANIGSDSGFGFMRRFSPGQQTATNSNVDLKVALSVYVFLLGVGVSIIGAIISGFFASIKASALKPLIALRNLE